MVQNAQYQLSVFTGARAFVSDANDKTVVGWTAINPVRSTAWPTSAGDAPAIQVSVGLHTYVVAVNSKGVQVGHTYVERLQRTRAFVCVNGEHQLIDPLPGHENADSYAIDVNDSGVVIGLCNLPGDNYSHRIFVYDPATGIRKVEGLDGSVSDQPMAINNQGLMLGLSRLRYAHSNVTHSFVRDTRDASKPPIDLGIPEDMPQVDIQGSNVTPKLHGRFFPYSINGEDLNDSGQVVGYTRGGGSDFPFTWSEKNGIQRIEVAPGSHLRFIWALGINNSGVIVGKARLEEKDIGVIVTDSRLATLNSLLDSPSRWEITSARRISNGGVIVGTAMSDTSTQDYVLTLVQQ